MGYKIKTGLICPVSIHWVYELLRAGVCPRLGIEREILRTASLGGGWAFG